MERALVLGRATSGIRVVAIVLGALMVAAIAQVPIPLPGTPVPMTIQRMAVLLVGGLLGARLAALSMILYLARGAAGLPVFTPSPLLLPGIARLFGQTGGYLLAYPIAAYAVGALLTPGRRPGENPLVTPRHRPGVSPAEWVRTPLPRLPGRVRLH